jgi:hypothetical protein
VFIFELNFFLIILFLCCSDTWDQGSINNVVLKKDKSCLAVSTNKTKDVIYFKRKEWTKEWTKYLLKLRAKT